MGTSVRINGDDVLVDGELIGTTLVLNTKTGTANIDMSGLSSGGIDFASLGPLQQAALLSAVRGNTALDAAGNFLGHYVA